MRLQKQIVGAVAMTVFAALPWPQRQWLTVPNHGFDHAALDVAVVGRTGIHDPTADLPERIADEEFWRLTIDMSEPDAGGYSDDNLVSNEIPPVDVLSALTERVKPGAVFVGVGPEQNFTYIATLKPKIAFITDIRRVNWHVQLLYKAVFELSTDRADFLSRLFARRKPVGLQSDSDVLELMNAFASANRVDDAVFDANTRDILDLLTRTHNWPLSAEDKHGVARVYKAFQFYGLGLNSVSHLTLATYGIGISGPTYYDLMIQKDPQGRGLSYLGSEQHFATVKALQGRNLVVPIVGNFAGSKALRRVGTYLKDHGASLDAFYLSNVENYLRRDRLWETFCANVATMPLLQSSVFLRARTVSLTYYPSGVAPRIRPSQMEIVPISGEVIACKGR
jgi:hypothetical protein